MIKKKRLFSIHLTGTIIDKNGHKLSFTEKDVTHIEIKDPIDLNSKLVINTITIEEEIK